MTGLAFIEPLGIIMKDMADDKKERKWNWDLFDKTPNRPGAKGNNDPYAGQDELSSESRMSDVEMERLSDLLERAVPLIEQVNSLYNQYRMGTERKPPIERRQVLDQVMNSIQLMRKPTEGARFRVRQIAAKYMSYKDRWDRILKAMESSGDPHAKKGFKRGA